MKSIEHEIQKAFFHECFVFDNQSGGLFWKERPLSHFKNESYQKRWNAKYSSKLAGSLTYSQKGFARKHLVVNNKIYFYHRVIYTMFVGEIPEGMSIDHIDGNSLNNRVENLRVVNHYTNHRNRKIQKNNKTGYQGIRLIGKKYYARAKLLGKEKSLGSFEKIEDAVKARFEYLSKHGFTRRHLLGDTNE